MEGQPSRRILDTLKHRANDHPGTGSTAACVTALCGEICTALTPIVGPRGVAALYKRSLFLASHEHPVLLGLHATVQQNIDLSALTATLMPLSETDATQVGATLLSSFYELLSSLIGPSLTERLLHSLWDRPLSDPPAMEPSP
ncbi:MAG: hypothetical protein JNM58_16755 [Xanthomonadaceae bacterium]|nr:hypothetical protein [Xanthomonadaceae bacterium]